jgi:Zn finger protein HypA/HybF involved in hydrogenase expression
VARRKESDLQTGLPFSRSPTRERTLEVRCDNCKARFVAWYGTEEEAETETVDVEKCGLCGGTASRKDNFKDCTLRLMAQVTARGVKRGD